jgi:hypothetical protein
MRRIAALIAAPVVALTLSACSGDTAQQACQKNFGASAKAVPNGDEEAYCVVPGQQAPVGEVDDSGFGFEADED